VNAINYAATALLIIKKWPSAPIIPVVLSVQLVEFLWVHIIVGLVVVGFFARLQWRSCPGMAELCDPADWTKVAGR